MGRREPLTPAAAKALDEIRRLARPGVLVTQGGLMRSMSKSKNAVAAALAKLESGGWIKRGRYRPGLARPISVKDHK